MRPTPQAFFAELLQFHISGRWKSWDDASVRAEVLRLSTYSGYSARRHIDGSTLRELLALMEPLTPHQISVELEEGLRQKHEIQRKLTEQQRQAAEAKRKHEAVQQRRREYYEQGRAVVEAERERLQQRRREFYEQGRAVVEAERERLQQVVDRFRQHINKLAAAISDGLSQDFLDFDRRANNLWPQSTRNGRFYKQRKTRFVRNWAHQHYQLELDEEQAAAVGAVNGNALVTARAGSGKTRVLTARALFLHKHCGVPVHKIMLLAFNRRAASEMEHRLHEWLGDEIPHVMTFHALAYSLVQPSQKLLFDDKDEGKQDLSDITQQVINEHVRHPDWTTRIRNLMLDHFKADWTKIETGGYHLSDRDFLNHRYSLQSETLRGDKVNNFGQKAIANLLTEYSVQYWYKSTINWGGRRMLADFSLPRSNTFPVYIGFTGHGESTSETTWQRLRDSVDSGKFKGDLLEYKQEQLETLGEDGFAQLLLRDLKEQGLQPKRLSDEQLWMEVRKRSLDQFTNAMKNFVGRCRQRAWTVDDLDHEAVQRKMHLGVTEYELEFYRIGRSVYSKYLEQLEINGREDFNGIMIRAAQVVRSGTTRFERKGNAGDIRGIDYLHVDEFQDFSRSFYDLTATMMASNPNLTVFGVGDDWQAINGFAGSVLKYFRNFGEFFPQAKRLAITHNYRSGTAIVKASNALLTENDTPSEATLKETGSVQICNLDEFRPTPVETAYWSSGSPNGNDATRDYEIAVARIAQHLAAAGELALLNRTRDPDVLTGASPSTAQRALRRLLPRKLRDCVVVDTAHSFKGLERDSIVILDAVANHYPLIHPHWIFGQIFGDTLDSIDAAEKRLFYVAVTRPHRNLIICTQSSKRSAFLAAIQEKCKFRDLDINKLPTIAESTLELCEVRVFNSFEVKDSLKDDDFGFVAASDSGEAHWSRVLPREEITDRWIDKAPWNVGRVRVEVYNGANKCIWSSDDKDVSALPQAEPF